MVGIAFYDSTPFLSQERDVETSWVTFVINKTLCLKTPVAVALLPDLLVVYESRLQPLAKSLALQLTAVQVALTPMFTLNVPLILNLNKTSPSAFFAVCVLEPLTVFVAIGKIPVLICCVMVVVIELPSSKYSVVSLIIMFGHKLQQKH